jgi:hypothetical protein
MNKGAPWVEPFSPSGDGLPQAKVSQLAALNLSGGAHVRIPSETYFQKV